MQLIPFDLERDELRNDIVDIGRAGDVDGQRFLTVVVITPAATRCALHLPALDVDVEHPLEDLGRLPEHDPPHDGDAGRKTAQRVDQGARVRLGRSGLRVEAGPHSDVRLFQHLELGFSRAAQQGAVRSGIQLNGIPTGYTVGVGIDIRHCGYYPARFRKPAGDIGSPIYMF